MSPHELATWSVAVTAAVLAVAATPASHADGSRFHEAVHSHGGVVASVSPAAAQAGIAALDAGGNAIDAAAAAVFAVGVARPELCGIGGGGFLVYRSARGGTRALDFRERAPATYTFTRGIFGAPGVPAIGFGTGHGVVGVPGVVAGMDAAVRRFGRRSLAQAIAPAERLARVGVEVTGETAGQMRVQLGRLLLYDETRRTYLRNGLFPYDFGDILVQPGYADSLRLIAEGGADAFYKGPIAQAIAAAMASSGRYPGDAGTMTAQDLADYRAIWRPPLIGSYRGRIVVGMPPPSSGGLATLEVLNLLEGYDVRGTGRSSAAHLHLLAEAEKIAWADRNAYVGDSDFVDVPIAEMTSKAYAARRRAEIDPLRAKTYEAGARQPAPATPAIAETPGHTTHVSVIDKDGNAVAVTCTIEQLFGSAVVAPGTGFLLNNQLTDFDGPGTANAPGPRKRPRSSMTPTIVIHKGAPVLVAGGAGGPSIIMGAIQTVINTVDFGLDPARAIDAERIDARGLCAGGGLQLCAEDARLSPVTIDGLRARGHELQSHGEYAPRPNVQVAGTDRRRCVRMAATDPRNGAGKEYDGALGQRRAAPRRRPRTCAARRVVSPPRRGATGRSGR